MPDDLNAQGTIERAFLQAASADTVYDWLKERAPKESVHGIDIPEALLDALHARHERLIDLALAQFCTLPGMLKQLYREGDEALKCAVLSNRLANIFWMPSSHHLFTFTCLFTEEEHQAFAREASPPLLEAYISNPSLEPEILEAVFLRTKPFNDIDDERWKRCIIYAAANTRLHHDYPHGRFADSDGWSHYKHGTPITAAWKLLDTLPATEEWAAILHRLYEKMVYRGAPREIHPATRPEEAVGERGEGCFSEWMRNITERSLAFLRDLFLKWRSAEEASDRYWNYFCELRCVVASRIPIHDEQIRTLLRDHEDLYVRKGYYQQFQPSNPDEVQAGYSRDGKDFIEAAVENPWFYRKGHPAVCSVLYTLIHDNDVLRGTNAEVLRSRYHRLGEYWSEKDPHAFEFDEIKLMRSASDEEEEWPDQPSRSSLARVGRQLGEVVYSASRKDSDTANSLAVMRRLLNALEEFEQRHGQQLIEMLRALRERLDSFWVHTQRLAALRERQGYAGTQR